MHVKNSLGGSKRQSYWRRSDSPKKEVFVSINKFIVLGAAFILAWLLGFTPTSAQAFSCDPLAADYDANQCDQDGDGIMDVNDTCDNLDQTLDCDGDGVYADACPNTVSGVPLVVGACSISGHDDVIPEGSGPDAGCSVTEVLSEDIAACELTAKNHGKFVSCVSHATNALKKQKLLTGREKGQIQRCAAQSDIGKKSHP